MITFNTRETGLHMNRLPVLLLFMFICISCAAPAVGPQFKVHESIPKESALIYVYRPEKLGVTVCINIYVDKKLIGCLGSGGYLKMNLPPGIHEIFTDPKALGSPVEFGFSEDFVNGSVRYFKYTSSQGNKGGMGEIKSSFQQGFSPYFVLFEMQEKVALQELVGLKDSSAK